MAQDCNAAAAVPLYEKIFGIDMYIAFDADAVAAIVASNQTFDSDSHDLSFWGLTPILFKKSGGKDTRHVARKRIAHQTLEISGLSERVTCGRLTQQFVRLAPSQLDTARLRER
ncbi:hypothetical protein DWG18_02530 [Lysobacter sp. TY2-98]|nr:hypothetical protein DWG18_02530 [Lysobacter sp. TY2-98]